MQLNAITCQMIVEDQLNYLMREKFLTRSQCEEIRDQFFHIIITKVNVKIQISKETLDAVTKSMDNLKKGKVGKPINVKGFYE